jgi:integrase
MLVPMAKPRQATGGAFEHRGRYFLRVTIAPGKRAAVALPWASSREAALERACVVQGLVDRLREAGHTDLVPKVIEAAAAEDLARLEAIVRAVDGLLSGRFVVASPKASEGGPLTFRAFGERWTSGELSRLYPDHVATKRTADDDAMRLEKWVYPVVKDLPLRDFTLAHAQEVLRRIPSSLSRGTRRHVAQLMARVLSLAAYPCEAIAASPLPRGFVPRVSKRVAFAYLYPSEDAAILACAPDPDGGREGIPLANRLLYGFLCREGLRCEEALKLTWADVDLERGTLRCDVNKTSDPRTWMMDPSCTRALVAWRALRPNAQPGGRIFGAVFKPYHLARVFRLHLKLAGLTRPELYETGPSRRPIRAHDCRGSFITLALATGRTETWVVDRTGHRSSTMLARYRRMARSAEELGLGWFAPLDTAIPELNGDPLAAAKTAALAAAEAPHEVADGDLSSRNHSWFQRMDSNHDKRNQNPLSCH